MKHVPVSEKGTRPEPSRGYFVIQRGRRLAVGEIWQCHHLLQDNLDWQNQLCLKNEVRAIVVKTSAKARREGKFILDLFQIYTSNPMVILQQEEAKEFLSTTSPAGFWICIHYIRILIQHSQFFFGSGSAEARREGKFILDRCTKRNHSFSVRRTRRPTWAGRMWKLR